MDLHQQAQALFQILAEALPVDSPARDSLQLNDDNECFLPLSETLLVMFYLDENLASLILNVPVGPVPDGPEREATLVELLCANYCWNLTEGATLGIDRETGVICLSYLVPLPLDPPQQIIPIIEKLADVTLHWRKQFPALADGWTGESADLEPMMMFRV